MTWAQKVKERDKVCQSCGIEERLEAHHILRKSSYPQFSDDIENGITLCRKCHRAAHNGSFYQKGSTLLPLERNPVEVNQKIKQFVEQQCESLNSFINRAIDETIERESK